MSTERSRWAWALVRHQHGVIAWRQLVALGFSPKAIGHRVRTGRLRRIHHGVYAVSPLDLSREGAWFGAVLACGPDGFLTHRSAGALHGICAERPGRIEVGVRRGGAREPRGIRLRRRRSVPRSDLGRSRRVPVTAPARTLVDLATDLGPRALLRAVNEADKLGVIGVEELRSELGRHRGVRGVRTLRQLLDRDTFVLTEDELERLFLPLAREAGLPLPETGRTVNGFAVDFFWPRLS